jgi:hypothetical protein
MPKSKEGFIWTHSHFEDEWSLVASILRDHTPEEREKELAEMKPYYREGVLRWLDSYEPSSQEDRTNQESTPGA